jgi:hypothetical protein
MAHKARQIKILDRNEFYNSYYLLYFITLARNLRSFIWASHKAGVIIDYYASKLNLSGKFSEHLQYQSSSKC